MATISGLLHIRRIPQNLAGQLEVPCIHCNKTSQVSEIAVDDSVVVVVEVGNQFFAPETTSLLLLQFDDINYTLHFYFVCVSVLDVLMAKLS